MTLRETLLRLALIKTVKDFLDVEEAATKAALKAEVGGRMGATGAILPDGSEGATVWITKPTHHPADRGGVPYVANPALFTEWVKTVDPSAIVESVRTTDVPRLLGQAAGWLIDTGELPPGVELSEPRPAYYSGGGSVSVKQSDEQAAAMAAAWRSGEINRIVMDLMPPELEGPEG